MIILIVSLSLEADKLVIALQDESFNHALLTFDLVKGLNAVIILLHVTKLSFIPVGVCLNLSIGEIQDNI
ncbi:MAG: hypothetical protein DSZ04_03850 [Sulfurimonas sp.]|nr:MAG: hypothetical protein DSZ04_03850 [Sulfurimonas sp.]